ncbi:T. brucei spp.-specific protein [Trypanosoma brucei gambiense DAL972]|uniref:T. brucei spp.-specific protein n=1 Tax=Trypanosoma brucei gambiense (strain MHOM/CI/86/DAL972) TaxID=679716 RepID=D0A490_TRYB9|nr:T. brucei spp.-specific protein [Trypanosoma brucei gambiense DAL972]CBH16084.1 T. brucei spp.-specific protein [Trypanosoma brucei gambiense DAL972]|eukprot:XP_011778348.1 T. brucei spp.-specific protein [Trypanosoma brucei gambiense DAL972]
MCLCCISYFNVSLTTIIYTLVWFLFSSVTLWGTLPHFVTHFFPFHCAIICIYCLLTSIFFFLFVGGDAHQYHGIFHSYVLVPVLNVSILMFFPPPFSSYFAT